MKQIVAVLVLLFAAFAADAQDVILLKTGESINAKVAEVGVNEIKYYKASNPEGPVYVNLKADVAQITYVNGTKDVFSNVPAPVPPGTVDAVQQTYRFRRPVRIYSPFIFYPLVVPHIDLGHHVDVSHHGSHYNSHHGRGHH